MSRYRILAPAILCLSLAATTAGAGIDFAHMPVNCSWVTTYSNGSVWRETFLGKRGGFFVVRTTDVNAPRNVVKTTRYDVLGRMVDRDWGGGKWEKFTPFSCYDEAGTCTYRLTNADGADITIVNTNTPEGDHRVVRAGIKGGGKFNDERVIYGPFGMSIRQWSKSFSDTTGDFQHCGDAVS